MSNFAPARANMVEGHIRPNHVADPALLVALHSVPRELFVPEGAAGIAYIDGSIPVGNGRRLAEPLMLARLIQAAGVTQADTVLDVGCATGYSTAVLAQLARSVTGLESDADLAGRANAALSAAGVKASVVVGALPQGLPGQAPYDVIVISGAVTEVPRALLGQLKAGGRLVTVVVGGNAITPLGEARLYRRIGDSFPGTALFETQAPVLPGFEAKPRFAF